MIASGLVQTYNVGFIDKYGYIIDHKYIHSQCSLSDGACYKGKNFNIGI